MVPTGTTPTTPSHGPSPGTNSGHRPSTALAAFPVLNLAHAHLSWTIKFEMCRRKLVARKLQAVVRSFLNHASVMIPKTVRGMLRPGYLRGVRGIRTRQVHGWLQRVCLSGPHIVGYTRSIAWQHDVTTLIDPS